MTFPITLLPRSSLKLRPSPLFNLFSRTSPFDDLNKQQSDKQKRTREQHHTNDYDQIVARC